MKTIIKDYFNVSNESNFDEIEKYFTTASTYSSQNTGLYLWVEDILKMQKSFHNSFNKLHWDINEIKEIKAWIFLVDFNFVWEKKTWEIINFSWLEYIILYEWKIQHIEIKNK